MVRRVVSVVRCEPGMPAAASAVLETQAYALAEDLHLAVVLEGAGVEHAVVRGDGSRTTPSPASRRPRGAFPGDAGESRGPLAGDGEGPRDLRCLLESGVRVVAVAQDLRRRGLEPGDLMAGVEIADAQAAAMLAADAEAVLFW